jgi:restriction system protein
MAIPDFQTTMLPLLRLCGDGTEHTNRDAVECLASEFRLTPEERKQYLPSGRQRVFDNRIAWARAYLKMALLIENTRRGVFQITERGRQVLTESPLKLNLAYLRRFPEFDDNRLSRQQKAVSSREDDEDIQEKKTPRELLDEAYMILRANLAEELLSQLKAASPAFFEKVAIDVLVRMGYGGSVKEVEAAVVGKSGDEGIDGVIKEDRLGLDVIYVQAKRWTSTVSRPEIQKFAGALQGKRARKGVFITTSDFSKSASEYVSAIESKIILVDGRQLVEFMIDFEVGVSSDGNYVLKRLDSDYFEEG